VTPQTLLEKADRALASAEILLREGDSEAVCNRSYYAMFNAARAALLRIGAPPAATSGKSHSGLHAAFNRYLVKPGLVAPALGAAFRRAERLRHISDYLGNPIDLEAAGAILGEARQFVATARVQPLPRTS